MKKFLVLVLCLSFLSVEAQVSVNTGGTSDGAPLSSNAGPKGIRKPVRTRAKGGSIKSAAARSVFTRKRVVHGNKVVSKGTAGDAESTHVDANSVFAGTATFKSNDGNPVDDFTIDLALKGKLKCKSPEEDLPEFFSLAQMSADVIVDSDSKFSGGATQDGTGTFSAFGDVSIADFTATANQARIKKKFPINLGTLTDGQKLAFFFAGGTLVSYGAEVPITFCSADFFNTDTFSAQKKQAGKITIEAGQTVDPGFLSTNGGNLFYESTDDTLLNNVLNLRVVIALGGGNFEVTAAAPGDIDNDGVMDVVVDAGSDQSSMLSAVQSAANNSVFIFGTTSTGDAFSGILDTNN